MKLAHLIPIFALSSTCYAGITAPSSGSNIPSGGSTVFDSVQSTFTINTIGSVSGASNNFRFGGSNDASGYLVGTYDINVTGGNATVSNNPSSATRVKGISVELGSGVTEFDVTLTYNRYLHGNR